MSGSFPEQHVSCLHDESRLSGLAEGIVFPVSESAAIETIRRSADHKRPLTIQGARTGLAGGAVPIKGLVMNMSEMNRPLSLTRDRGGFLLQVQPGYLLSSLRRDLRRGKFDWLEPDQLDPDTLQAFNEAGEQFWPPDPSELTATIGGIASTNGRGPGAYRYGSASEHIQALRLVRADGRVYDLGRGNRFVQGRVRPPWGEEIQLDPALLNLEPGADLIDLFLGGEGMYGLISALTLRLKPKPAEMWGIAFFFPDEKAAAGFVDQTVQAGLKSLSVLDFLDGCSLGMVRELKRVAAKLREISDAPEGAEAAVFLELHAATEDEIEESARILMELAEEQGSDPDSSWALSGDEIEKLRLFRHAVPESVNTRLDQIRLTYPLAVKLGGDMTVPGATFTETLARCRRDLEAAGVEAVVFGHCGQNHLHVNFLPQNDNEGQKAGAVMKDWLIFSRERGGRLFREHGIGKLKKSLFHQTEAPPKIEAIRGLKNLLDPEGFWNPGNIFEDDPCE